MIYLERLDYIEVEKIWGVKNEKSNNRRIGEHILTRKNDLNNKLDLSYMIKKIITSEPLSIQVHPNANIAKNMNYSGSKNEFWYILEADYDSFVLLGHVANTEKQFENMAVNKKWKELMIKKNVKKGDFFFVPAGTIHSIGAGIKLIEIQDPIDITFRLYDFERTSRNINFDDGFKAVCIPHCDIQAEPFILSNTSTCKISLLCLNSSFTVIHYKIIGEEDIEMYKKSSNLFIYVICGNGILENKEIIEDNSYIIQNYDNYLNIKGELEFLIVY